MPLQDRALQVVQQEDSGNTPERLKGLDVSAEEALERLVQGENRMERPRPTQDQHERGQASGGAADRNRPEAAPVGLALLARQEVQAEVRLSGRDRAQRPDHPAELHNGAGVPPRLRHLEQPRGAEPGGPAAASPGGTPGRGRTDWAGPRPAGRTGPSPAPDGRCRRGARTAWRWCPPASARRRRGGESRRPARRGSSDPPPLRGPGGRAGRGPRPSGGTGPGAHSRRSGARDRDGERGCLAHRSLQARRYRGPPWVSGAGTPGGCHRRAGSGKSDASRWRGTEPDRPVADRGDRDGLPDSADGDARQRGGCGRGLRGNTAGCSRRGPDHRPDRGRRAASTTGRPAGGGSPWPRGPGDGRSAMDKSAGVCDNSGKPPTPPVGWVRPRARRFQLWALTFPPPGSRHPTRKWSRLPLCIRLGVQIYPGLGERQQLRPFDGGAAGRGAPAEPRRRRDRHRRPTHPHQELANDAGHNQGSRARSGLLVRRRRLGPHGSCSHREVPWSPAHWTIPSVASTSRNPPV